MDKLLHPILRPILSEPYGLTRRAGGGGAAEPLVDGYRVGDEGEVGTIYEGFTLSYADDFTDTWENLFVVPHKSPSSAASIKRNKYLSFQTYRSGARQPGGQLTQSTDTDPYNTGANDANRGVPVGSGNNHIADSVLTLGARYANVDELAAHASVDTARKLVSGVLMTDLAILGYADTADTGEIMYEARYRKTQSGSPAGGHTDFWTRSSEPDATSSTTFDVNHENFGWNYLPATLDPDRDPGGDDEFLSSDPGVMHTYSMIQSKSHSEGIRSYRDGEAEYIGYTSANVPDQNVRVLLTNHVVDSEAGDLSGWLAGATYDMEIDYIRVWRKTGLPHFKPLQTVSDVNIASGGSTVITLPSKSALWGDASVTEFVEQIPGEANSPGSAASAMYANATPFGPGCSYNSGTRELTVAPSDGKSGRAIFSVSAKKAGGSTCQPLIIVVNVGPKVNVLSTLNYETGVPFSLDVYAQCDCGELVTDGTARDKTISVTGLPSWASYDDETGLITGTPGVSDDGNHSVTIECTNSIGQTGSKVVSLEYVEAADPMTKGTAVQWSASANGTSHTSSGLTAISGTERSVIAVIWRSSISTPRTISSITLGGSTLPALGTAHDRDRNTIAFFLSNEAQSGEVAVTFSGTVVQCVVIQWPIDNLQSTALRDTGLTDADASNIPIDAVADGGIFAATLNNNTGTFTWAGLTKDVDFAAANVSGNMRVSGASALYSANEANHNVQADVSGTVTFMTTVAVSLR